MMERSIEQSRWHGLLDPTEQGREPSPERGISNPEARVCPICDSDVGRNAHFCPSCGAQLAPSQRPPAGIPVSEDELRPVTVLFGDVVGSTSLGERLAAEEVKALVGECVNQMSRAVEEYGGTVQAYQGDGICAYFGVPTAHENDPERATRAGLRILEVMRDYGRDIALAWGTADLDVRIGINTGQAAVGLVGAGDPQSVAVGDMTNIAARLQATAEPGTIVVGDPTAKRLVHLFDFEPLGDMQVRGREQPVAVFRLVGPQAVVEASVGPPLVGREMECRRLRTVVNELKNGRGQILVITGDAGIGKTRMLAEVRSLVGEGGTWLEGHCLSYGGLATWPFIEILRRWLGVEWEEAEVVTRTKARAKLGLLLGADLVDVLPPLARLLKIRLDPELEDRVPASSESLAREIRRAYCTWIEALTREGPVVLAIEDLHSADASTRELAENLLELTEHRPLLLATTVEPRRSSEGQRFRLRVLGDYAHRATEASLGPLPDKAAEQLLTGLLPGALDDASRAAIVARAEGNPLYLEEMLRALSEAQSLEGRHPSLITPHSPELLPAALENVLVARLDRIPKASRHLAQVAAVVGRTFPVSVIARATSTKNVRVDLAPLLQAEIVHEVNRYPEFECAFKHGLMQEAALSTLTPARRQELNARVAAVFEEVYADSLDDHLVRLAHYNAESGNLQKTLEFLNRLAEQASETVGAGRASELWQRANRVAVELGDEEARRSISERLASLRS
jgi:class 3 adenylate cyclase